MLTVADGVLLNVDTILEDTLGSRLTWGGHTRVIDDLVWGSLHVVLGAEVEELLILLPGVILPLVLPVLLAVGVVLVLVVTWSWGSERSSGAENSEQCGGSEEHFE